MVAIALSIGMASVAAGSGEETLFKSMCAPCHPDGGNIIKPAKTLKRIKNSSRIIKKVRTGGGGMPSFDTKAISDTDVKQLADYIIKTFKK